MSDLQWWVLVILFAIACLFAVSEKGFFWVVGLGGLAVAIFQLMRMM